MTHLNSTSPDRAVTSEQLLRLVEDVVRSSFCRCMGASDEFFDDFYETLSARAPGLGTLCAHVEMQQQNQLIRQGVEHLIDYATGNEQSAQELRRLGKTHGRSGLNVRPELYSVWIDTLVETIRKHDQQSTDDIEAAWRVVVRGGIEQMTSLY